MTGIVRVLRVIGGFTLLAVGIALLVLPGPGWLLIAAALALLAPEFAWARWALDKVKAGGRKIADRVTSRHKNT
jgi:tellurite resistance protein TerC